MYSHLCSLRILLLTSLVSEIANQDPAEPATKEDIAGVNSRIDTLTVAQDQLKSTVESMDSRLSQLEKWELEDFSSLSGRITKVDGNQQATYNNLVATQGDLAAARGDLSALMNNVSASADELTRLKPSVTNLVSSNQLWRRNFRVLNRTIGELRKRFKLNPRLMG